MKIPPRIKVKYNRVYEILFVDSFEKENIVGECRFDKHQIVILNKLTKEESIKTFWHEFAHAVADEYKLKISHKDIYKLEKILFNIYKWNRGIFQDDRRATKRI
jgi:Zn-dependent peptidase ImmA (M78 family)